MGEQNKEINNMSLNISTNTAALRAGTALAVNQTRLQSLLTAYLAGRN